MKKTEIADIPCWACGDTIYAVSDFVGDNEPREGDISFCISCSAPGVFNEDLSLRKPTEEEMEEILRHPESIRHMLAIIMLHDIENEIKGRIN